MKTNEIIEKAVDEFAEDEELSEEVESKLRNVITNVKELRYAIAYASQKYDSDIAKDVTEALTSL